MELVLKKFLLTYMGVNPFMIGMTLSIYLQEMDTEPS
jgi:hypothetical protein